MTEYEQRNSVLKSIGFSSYQEYLESSLWKKIRRRVLEEANGECVLCHKPATSVHHTDYLRNTLLGKNTEGLVALCGVCHELGEFDTNGRKVSLSEANQRLKLLSAGVSTKNSVAREKARKSAKRAVIVAKRSSPEYLRRKQERQEKKRLKQERLKLLNWCPCGSQTRKQESLCRKCKKIAEANKPRKRLPGICDLCGHGARHGEEPRCHRCSKPGLITQSIAS